MLRFFCERCVRNFNPQVGRHREGTREKKAEYYFEFNSIKGDLMQAQIGFG
jgi:hypothetical protein